MHDLAVGAGGTHSNVRRLIFGDESQFAFYLGYYFATFPVPNLDHFEDGAIICLEPNRQATVYPDCHGGYTALLVYRAQEAGRIAAAQCKPMLEAHYAGAGWVIPQMIASITDSTPVYLDSVEGELLGHVDQGLGHYADAFSFHLQSDIRKKLSAGHYTYAFSYDAESEAQNATRRRIKLDSICLVARKGYERPIARSASFRAASSSACSWRARSRRRAIST